MALLIQTESERLWTKLDNKGRTVRPTGPDHPPYKIFAHQRQTCLWPSFPQSCEPSTHLGRTVRHSQSAQHMKPSFHFLKTLLAFMHATRIFEQNGTREHSSKGTRTLLIVQLFILLIRSFSSTNLLLIGKNRKALLYTFPLSSSLDHHLQIVP